VVTTLCFSGRNLPAAAIQGRSAVRSQTLTCPSERLNGRGEFSPRNSDADVRRPPLKTRDWRRLEELKFFGAGIRPWRRISRHPFRATVQRERGLSILLVHAKAADHKPPSRIFGRLRAPIHDNKTSGMGPARASLAGRRRYAPLIPAPNASREQDCTTSGASWS